MPNPYHAKNGRFTTKGGAAMTVGRSGSLPGKVEKAQRDKTRNGIERVNSSGRGVFTAKGIGKAVRTQAERNDRVSAPRKPGHGLNPTHHRRGNTVTGYKMQDSLENGYGSGNKNAAGEQTRTKRMNGRTVRDRSNSLNSPPEPFRPVPAKRPELKFGASADQNRRRRRAITNDGADAIGQMNYEAIAGGANPYESGARFRKVNNDGYPAGASGGNMTRSESNKYHAEMARKDGRSGAPRSRSNRSVGAKLDAQDSWKTNQKKPKKVSGSRFPLGGRLPF